MPAHTAPSAVGVRLKSTGMPVTPVDHRANALVDGLAKKAAADRRVPEHLRSLVDQAASAIEHSAATLGAVTYAANNRETACVSDDGTMHTKIDRDAIPLAKLARKAASKAVKDEREKKKEEAVAKAARIALVNFAKRRLARKRRITDDEIDLRRRREDAKALLAAARFEKDPGMSFMEFELTRSDEDYASSDEDAISLHSSAPGVPTRTRSTSDEELFDPAEDSFRDAVMANVDFQWEDEDDYRVPEDRFEGQRSSSSNQGVMMKDGTYSNCEGPARFDITERCSRFEMSDGEISLESDIENAVIEEDAAAPMDTFENDELENLFEPEAQSRVTQNLVVRSQPAVGMAAGSADPVGGAAAHTPTTRQNSDTARPVRKQRGTSEAQVVGSSTVLSEQQLNAQRQNVRRARAKAAERTPADKSSCAKKGKGAPPPAQEGRILEAVAEFWARKKAKAAAKGNG